MQLPLLLGEYFDHLVETQKKNGSAIPPWYIALCVVNVKSFGNFSIFRGSCALATPPFHCHFRLCHRLSYYFATATTLVAEEQLEMKNENFYHAQPTFRHVINRT